MGAAVQLLDFLACATYFPEDGRSTPHEYLTCRRQDHPSRSALEQGRTKFPFELVDASCDCRLSEAELTRGGRRARPR